MIAPTEPNAFDKAVTVVFLSAFSVIVLWTAYLKRHWYAFSAAKYLICFALWCLLQLSLHSLGLNGAWVYYVTFTAVVPLFFSITWKPTQSRRIRLEAIADYEALHGESSYNSSEMHLDHFCPSSLHGGHTTDNLWGIPKTENLRKGDNAPSLSQWVRFARYRWRVWACRRRRKR